MFSVYFSSLTAIAVGFSLFGNGNKIHIDYK